MKALKALVYEKGEKFIGGEIPRICSCGALSENLINIKKNNANAYDEDIFNMCASNC